MRILFASMPFDGHFLPLTGLAHHLAQSGHDARFYTGPSYARRLAALGVPHLPFRRATEINGANLAEHFPEVERLKGQPGIRPMQDIRVAGTPAQVTEALRAIIRRGARRLTVNFADAPRPARRCGRSCHAHLRDPPHPLAPAAPGH